MENAVVIGNGTVGSATARAFGITKYYSRSEKNIDIEEVAKMKYIFICLPTPTINGKCFTSDIEQFVKAVCELSTIHNIFIIRSTVYPGFNKYLQETFNIEAVVSNPEFLSEDTALEDALAPDVIVIGSDNIKYLQDVAALYKGRFKSAEYVLTDSVTSELIKYSLNAFFASKVVFANEIYDYAKKTHANYQVIKDVLEAHKWGSKNHFRVFDKGGRGAGGKCLQKDLAALAADSKSNLFREINIINAGLLLRSKKE